MQKNIELFNYSISKPEPFLEGFYKKGELVITKTKEEKNDLIKANEKLIELITTYKTMVGKLSEVQELVLIDEIIKLIFETEHMNYSAFSQYLMVCDLSYTILQKESLDSKRKIIREVLIEYIRDRHSIYLSHGYSNIILQVMSDNYSHKRNSRSGVEKVEQQILRRKIPYYNTMSKGNFYLLVDKSKSAFYKILSDNGIRFRWSSARQEKLPDILLNYNNIIYIIEHKHMKEGGGGQSKQDTEIVDLIRSSEQNVSYVTYLDGPYFNRFAQTRSSKKERTLKTDIIDALKENPNNYFLNTAGFDKFLDEL